MYAFFDVLVHDLDRDTFSCAQHGLMDLANRGRRNRLCFEGSKRFVGTGAELALQSF